MRHSLVRFYHDGMGTENFELFAVVEKVLAAVTHSSTERLEQQSFVHFDRVFLPEKAAEQIA